MVGLIGLHGGLGVQFTVLLFPHTGAQSLAGGMVQDHFV